MGSRLGKSGKSGKTRAMGARTRARAACGSPVITLLILIRFWEERARARPRVHCAKCVRTLRGYCFNVVLRNLRIHTYGSHWVFAMLRVRVRGLACQHMHVTVQPHIHICFVDIVNSELYMLIIIRTHR